MKLRLVLVFIVIAALSRLLPHPPNFTPIGAMGLFAAAYFGGNRLMLAVPFIAVFLSDLVLNNLVYSHLYDGFTLLTSPWMYVAMAAVMAVGAYVLSGKVSPSRVVAASLTASALFFLISNFWSWAAFPMYPKTPAGLAACFAAALPFARNSVLGDLFFSGVLFGTYHFVVSRKLVPGV